MNIYHGSKVIIDHPKSHGSNPTNDYGPAFYLTRDLNAAKSWACRNDIVGVVNRYQINTASFHGLKKLDLTDKSLYNVLHWMAILMHFRSLDASFRKNNQLVLDWLERYYINVEDYDVVIGFRADDSYFRFPIRFLTNDLAFEDLEQVFLSGQLGVQYAFISPRAINLLSHQEIISCENNYLGHYHSIVTEASREFDALLQQPRDPNKTYILDLMRKQP